MVGPEKPCTIKQSISLVRALRMQEFMPEGYIFKVTNHVGIIVHVN